MSEEMSPQIAEREAQRLIEEFATSFRDDSTPAPTGAQPVTQPDSRLVPGWAVGAAVAAIGLGAGSVGLGCAVWLASQGLAAITVTGVLAALAPFVGVALVALAVGAALSRAARSGDSTHVYTGPVTHTTQVTTHARGISRPRTEVR